MAHCRNCIKLDKISIVYCTFQWQSVVNNQSKDCTCIFCYDQSWLQLQAINLEKHGLKSTNHNPHTFWIYLSFLRGLLIWLTTGKHKTINWAEFACNWKVQWHCRTHILSISIATGQRGVHNKDLIWSFSVQFISFVLLTTAGKNIGLSWMNSNWTQVIWMSFKSICLLKKQLK